MTILRHRCLSASLCPLIDKFYRQHRSPMRSRSADEHWVTERAGQIIAAVNLYAVTNGQWLSGLFVAPEQRSQGVAGDLLQDVLAAHPVAIWLFCQPQLHTFYSRHGFRACQELPAELAERLTRYQRNKTLLALRVH